MPSDELSIPAEERAALASVIDKAKEILRTKQRDEHLSIGTLEYLKKYRILRE